MARKFNSETCAAFVELIADGLTVKDAAREVAVREKTVKDWITRGRAEKDGPYSDFAAAYEGAREENAERETPMNEAELLLEVSRAAKKGSVAAQKLYWEMLRASDSNADEDEGDAFDKLDQEDELAERRKTA